MVDINHSGKYQS